MIDQPSAPDKAARSALNHNGRYIWSGDYLVLRAIIETNRVVGTTRLRCHVNKFHNELLRSSTPRSRGGC